MCGDTCRLLQPLLTRLRLCHTSCVLTGFRFSLRFLTCQLGGTALCCLCLGFLTSLFGSTLAGFLHFYGYLAVNLGIEFGVHLLLLVYDLLYGLLLFLQRRHHVLLLCLLTFQRLAFLLTFIQEVVLVTTNLLQLLVLLVYLRLFGFQRLALRLLIRGVLTHKAQTAVHLREVMGREYEHQAVLESVASRDEAHGIDILRLALGKLTLQRAELRVEHIDVALDVGNVFLYVVYILLTLSNLAIDNHKVAQTLLHVSLIGTQSLLLLTYFLLYLQPLVLQTANGRVGIFFRRLSIRPRFSLAFGGGCLAFARRSLAGDAAFSWCFCRGGRFFGGSALLLALHNERQGGDKRHDYNPFHAELVGTLFCFLSSAISGITVFDGHKTLSPMPSEFKIDAHRG